jgi:hypothetical protein
MLFDPIEIRLEQYLPKISDLPNERVAKNLLSGEYADDEQAYAILLLIQWGYRFTSPEELQGLRKAIVKKPLYQGFYLIDSTLAHLFAVRGYIFSVSDLLVLGNIVDTDGESVAHKMVRFGGHFFTFDELLRLGNPSDKFGSTVAHEMAFHGFAFSTDDILRLGNPKTNHGEQIAVNMLKYGHVESSPTEVKAFEDTLSIPQDTLNKAVAFGLKSKLRQDGFPHVILSLKDGEPIFAEGEKSGGRLKFDVGFYSHDAMFWSDVSCAYYVEDGKIKLVEGKWDYENKNWRFVKTADVYNPNFSVIKVALAELLRNLNEAVRKNEEFDITSFTSDSSPFAWICDRSVQMKIVD